MEFYEVDHKYKDKNFSFTVSNCVLPGKGDLTHLSKKILKYLNRFLSYHPDFFYLINSDYEFEYVSPSLLRLWNIRLSEAKGKSFKELGYPEELVSLHNRQMDLAFAGKVVRGENSFTSKEVGWGYYEYIFVPLVDEQDNVQYVGGVTRDITQRIIAEKERKEMIYAISHDLKNPLFSIMGGLDALKEYLKSEEALKYHDMVTRNTTRMHELINGIIESAEDKKSISLRLKLVDLAEVVEEAIEFLEAAYSFRFEFRKPKKLICGYYDKYAIYRIVENLGQNALKYGDSKRPIKISLRILDEQCVALSVHNWGTPIPEDKFDTIFKMFVRGESENNEIAGLGIGLATVSRLVHRHKGKVELSSSEKEGTTFTIILPYES